MEEKTNKKLQMEDLNRPNKDSFAAQNKFPMVVILDNIRSMHNVGSIFRSADAFNVEAIYLCGMTAQPPHRDIEKTALGATETVKWQYFAHAQAAVADLKSRGYSIIAVEQAQNTQKLGQIAFKTQEKEPAPVALIFGNEVHGVQQNLIDQADFCVEIPQWGTKHSLNVAVCAGIVLWEWVRGV